jgi:hypothetical protein
MTTQPSILKTKLTFMEFELKPKKPNPVSDEILKIQSGKIRSKSNERLLTVKCYEFKRPS